MIMLFEQEYATEAYVKSEVRKAEQRGRAKGRISLLASLVESGLLSKEIAAQQAGMSVDEFERKSTEL